MSQPNMLANSILVNWYGPNQSAYLTLKRKNWRGREGREKEIERSGEKVKFMCWWRWYEEEDEGETWLTEKRKKGKRKKINVDVKGGRRKLKDLTMIDLHIYIPTNLFDYDDRTQRWKSQVHVRGQWDEEEKEGETWLTGKRKRKKHRNWRVDFCAEMTHDWYN